MSIENAFDSFMRIDFESAVNSSTIASFGGSGYSVELFPTGNYRLLWDGEIGNRYDSSGLLLSVPQLTDEEWDSDPDLRFYENAADQIRGCFSDRLR